MFRRLFSQVLLQFSFLLLSEKWWKLQIDHIRCLHVFKGTVNQKVWTWHECHWWTCALTWFNCDWSLSASSSVSSLILGSSASGFFFFSSSFSLAALSVFSFFSFSCLDCFSFWALRASWLWWANASLTSYRTKERNTDQSLIDWCSVYAEFEYK